MEKKQQQSPVKVQSAFASEQSTRTAYVDAPERTREVPGYGWWHSSSWPSPKRSLSCAGLDDFEELFPDNARTHPNRKRHQSLNSDNNLAATNFASSSPSRHDYSPPPASYPGPLRRPDLPPFSEKNSASGSFQLVPSTSFESRYPQTLSNQIRTPQSDQDQDNNYHDEHDFNDDFDDTDDYDDAAHEYPQEGLEHRLKLDHDVLAGKRLDHSIFLPQAHRSGSECSPREEFLVHAFGPSGFKLHGTSVSSNDEVDDSLSDDSSGNNRETSSSRHGATLADADTELKMSFSELEADIRGAMHQNAHHQHSPRLPELAGLPHQSFATSSHVSYGLNRSGGFPRSSQDLHHIPMFGQSQEARSQLLQSQKETTYFPREQQLHSPSRTPLVKTPHGKVGSGIQTPTKWLRDEDERLRVAVARFGGKNWKMIAETLGNGRTDVQCLHRWNKVLKPGLIKGPWTPEEDRILTNLITRYGVGKIRWCDLALHLPGRIGKQCRERWCNHLDSRIRKGQWTPEEDDMVFRWQQKLGNKWSEIAKLLPGRTENAVKNRFNSAARRKWLMNQANKTPATSTTPATSAAQSQPQLSPHTQLRQQQALLQSSPAHQECNVYNVPYGGGKVTPLPSTETLMEHQQHNPIPPLGRQNFLHHFVPPGAPPTNALLPGSLEGPPLPVFRPAALGNEPGFQHDKPPDIVKSPDSISLAPSTFVPPPLNSLFPPPPIGSSRSLHHLTSSPVGSEAPITPVFPFPAHLPTQAQSDSVLTPAKPKPGGDVAKEEEPPLERDGLVLEASTDAPASHAGPDPSVPMDDENMNSFLDSVTLELDEIMK